MTFTTTRDRTTGPVPRLRDALFDPSPGIVERAAVRRTRLLSAFTFGYALLLLQSALMTWLTAPPAIAAVVAPVLAVGAPAMFGAYLVSRTRHVRVAVWACLAVTLTIPPTLLLGLRDMPSYNPFESLVWQLPAILIASALVSTRGLALVTGIALAYVAAAGVFGPAEWIGPINEGGIFLFTHALLVIVLGVHRDRIERDRAKELFARNAELEALRQSLEHRVEERTAELRRANQEIAASYDSLQRNQEMMVLTEKMASLGRFTAGIAHEMSSPLAAARASTSTALQLVDEYERSIGDAEVEPEDHRAIAGELRESLELADQATERLCSFVRSIRAQTRGAADRRQVRFDVVAAIQDALHLVGHAAVTGQCRIRFHAEVERFELDGDPGRIAQIVTNLVGNAIDAVAEAGGGEILVALEHVDGELALRVKDCGPGIAPTDLPRIFDPLFTTKPVGQGTGLGLTIVHDIVRGDFGGRIDAVNLPEGGAMFTVHLPTTRMAA